METEITFLGGRVETFPQTAEYEIVVNTADHYATGAFTLSVTSGSKPKSVARCNRTQ